MRKFSSKPLFLEPKRRTPIIYVRFHVFCTYTPISEKSTFPVSDIFFLLSSNLLPLTRATQGCDPGGRDVGARKQDGRPLDDQTVCSLKRRGGAVGLDSGCPVSFRVTLGDPLRHGPGTAIGAGVLRIGTPDRRIIQARCLRRSENVE